MERAVNVFTILVAELKDTNIKVNSVHLGWVKTISAQTRRRYQCLTGQRLP